MVKFGNSIADPLLRLGLPRPPRRNANGLTRRRFRLIPFRSPLLGESRFLFFPAVTEMGQFTAFPTARYALTRGSWRITPSRFRI